MQTWAVGGVVGECGRGLDDRGGVPGIVYTGCHSPQLFVILGITLLFCFDFGCLSVTCQFVGCIFLIVIPWLLLNSSLRGSLFFNDE